MAKQTKMAEDAEQSKADRRYMAEADAWDQADSVEYGGQSEILELEIGEVAGPFEYVTSQPMVLDTGATTVHIGMKDEENYRLPISAAFLRAFDQARIQRGDRFLIKRLDDVKKLRGKGKDQMMKIYALKIVHRVEVAGSVQ